MPVPKYDEFFPPFMKCLSDGNVYSLSEIRSYCADYYNLSDADRVEPLNNGKSYKLNDRVGWARTYLKKAGLIESPERGKFFITDIGKDAVAAGIENITLDYLMQFESFREFVRPADGSNKDSDKDSSNKESRELSPQEMIDEAFSQMNSSLADDLMVEIMKMNCLSKLLVDTIEPFTLLGY